MRLTPICEGNTNSNKNNRGVGSTFDIENYQVEILRMEKTGERCGTCECGDGKRCSLGRTEENFALGIRHKQRYMIIVSKWIETFKNESVIPIH
jgi:hypothetical protein